MLSKQIFFYLKKKNKKKKFLGYQNYFSFFVFNSKKIILKNRGYTCPLLLFFNFENKKYIPGRLRSSISIIIFFFL